MIYQQTGYLNRYVGRRQLGLRMEDVKLTIGRKKSDCSMSDCQFQQSTDMVAKWGSDCKVFFHEVWKLESRVPFLNNCDRNEYGGRDN